jgi:membrane protein implicated in regulation of membrane protease activity
MNKKRLLLYLAFVIYHACAFAFTYMVDGHLDLLGLLKFIPWFKYIAFLGLLMIVLDVAWYFIDRRTNQQETKELKDENTNLKARIYDMQESAKKAEADKKP